MLEKESYPPSRKDQLFEQLFLSIDEQFSGYDLSVLSKYRKDPVGFGEKILNESYTDEVKTLLESVRDHRVTVAQSANVVGKSHAAARAAVWFLKCFGGKSKIYTAAAPPEDNLKDILWGEIGSITINHPELFKSDSITTLRITSSPESFMRGVAIPQSGACFRYGDYVERLITWGGMDTIETGDRAVEEYKKRAVMSALSDATGIGAGIAPHMQRAGCAARPVKVASAPTEKTDLGEFQILRDQLWWACQEWLRADPGAMLPPDEKLCEELATPTYEVVSGKIRIMKKASMRELLRRSPDRGDSLCLTFAYQASYEEIEIKATDSILAYVDY